MRASLNLWWRLRGVDNRDDRVPGLLSVLAFAVATGALLVCLGGLGAFEARNTGFLGPFAGQGAVVGDTYVTLAWIAVTCMVVPILTLGGVAARLAIARRDQRMAALRLAGATSSQVTLMTLADAASQALVGALLGVVVYVAALPVVATLTFQGRALSIGELIVPAWQVGLVVVGVAVVAILSGLSSLARVVISPLGVAARTTPRRLSLARVLVAVAACALWFVIIGPMKQPERGTIVALLAAVILAINATGPFFIMVAGRIAARLAPTTATLLAARRIADDPKSTWRAVGALGLGIVVAGFTTLAQSENTAGSAPDRQLVVDLGTGAIVTLAIITVIAATSTGVVQAARVLDQRAQYRSLSLAGTPLTTLHRARTYEIGLPLVVTVGLSAGFVLALILPFSSYLDMGLIVRFLVAAAAASAVMMLSVGASRSLVRRAASGI